MSEVPEDRLHIIEDLRDEIVDNPQSYREQVAEEHKDDVEDWISYDSYLNKFFTCFDGRTVFFDDFDTCADWLKLNTHRKQTASQ